MSLELLQLADWIFKLLGILLASTAIFQLRETKIRRMVDMYWKIADEYVSEDSHNRREAIYKIQDWLNEERICFNTKSIDLSLNEKLVSNYIETFHDAVRESPKKDLDTKARYHIRFLNQLGILVKKNLIDKDLLFSLIGSGLEGDYEILKVILESHRAAHNASGMYSQFDYLWGSYQDWLQVKEVGLSLNLNRRWLSWINRKKPYSRLRR